jgi:muramoyltetrapeptide carboxypeptidase
MLIVPPYLEKEDTIGIVCPAGYMAMDKVIKCMSSLQEWGYRIKLGNTVGSNSETYFSGTDEERLQDLQMMLDDTEVKAVLCARGGYGMSRIIDRIKFKKFKKKPKWVVGYSDITVFHSHVYTNYGISSLHAPMAAAFNTEVVPGTDEVEAFATGTKNEYILSLKNALEGNPINYRCHPHEFNREGSGKGELIGGNIALFSHIVGSYSYIKTKGRILFIEDIG